jgi:cell division transport system permease protein
MDRAKRGLLAEWRLHSVSLISLVVAFLCLGAAVLALVNARTLQDKWSQVGRISVYLHDNADPHKVDALVAALKKTPEVASARYMSPSDAQASVANGKSDSTLAQLPLDVFPASIEVDVSKNVGDAELNSFLAKMKAIPEVETIETYASLTERLAPMLSSATIAASVVFAIVFAAVIAMISSTMRLALHRRKTEVEVLRLVGATDNFVRAPYLLESAVLGAAGALVSIVLLFVGHRMMLAHLDADFTTMIGFDPVFLPPFAIAAMVATGALLGALGGAIGLRKLTTI